MTRFVFSTVFMLIISLFTSVNIYAQHAKCTISGKLVDEQATSIAYASIALYDEEKPVAGVVTDNEGRFTLMLNQSDKKFKLVVQYIGYARYEMPLTPNKTRVNLQTLTLREDATLLSEVVISAKGLAQKSTVEHTTINASSNLVTS